MIDTKSTSGSWRAVQRVGACSICAAPGFDMKSKRYKDPDFKVFELNISGQVSRLCQQCLEGLSGVVTLGIG